MDKTRRIKITESGSYFVIKEEELNEVVAPGQGLETEFLNCLGPTILEVGELIRFFREKNQLSLRDLDAKLRLLGPSTKISYSHLCSIEMGNTIPRPETISKLAILFGEQFEKAIALATKLKTNPLS